MKKNYLNFQWRVEHENILVDLTRAMAGIHHNMHHFVFPFSEPWLRASDVVG